MSQLFPFVNCPKRSVLELTLRDVFSDAIAGDAVEGIGLGDVLGALADDNAELDSPSRSSSSREG